MKYEQIKRKLNKDFEKNQELENKINDKHSDRGNIKKLDNFIKVKKSLYDSEYSQVQSSSFNGDTITLDTSDFSELTFWEYVYV